MSGIASVAALLVTAGRSGPLAVSVLLAVGVSVGAVSCAQRRRSRDAVRARCAGPPRPGGFHAGRRPVVGTLLRSWRVATQVAGSSIRRAAGRPRDDVAAARIGRALLVGLGAGAAGTGVAGAALVGFVVWAVPLVQGLARRSRERSAWLDELPEVVDLVRLAVGSGLNVRLALDAVVRHHDGRVVAALRDVLARADRGARLGDALDAMATANEAVAPLVDALVATERYGAPLVAALDRVAADARTARRRRREEAARRVPVKLLFPLVFCTLPAFALLTVVPVLLRSLPSLAP
jgi:tight adherence protein C